MFHSKNWPALQIFTAARKNCEIFISASFCPNWRYTLKKDTMKSQCDFFINEAIKSSFGHLRESFSFLAFSTKYIVRCWNLHDLKYGKLRQLNLFVLHSDLNVHNFLYNYVSYFKLLWKYSCGEACWCFIYIQSTFIYHKTNILTQDYNLTLKITNKKR